MTALLEYLDLLRDACKAQSCCRQKRICNILKVSMVVVRTCIDKQLACKLSCSQQLAQIAH